MAALPPQLVIQSLNYDTQQMGLYKKNSSIKLKQFVLIVILFFTSVLYTKIYLKSHPPHSPEQIRWCRSRCKALQYPAHAPKP